MLNLRDCFLHPEKAKCSTMTLTQDERKNLYRFIGFRFMDSAPCDLEDDRIHDTEVVKTDTKSSSVILRATLDQRPVAIKIYHVKTESMLQEAASYAYVNKLYANKKSPNFLPVLVNTTRCTPDTLRKLTGNTNFERVLGGRKLGMIVTPWTQGPPEYPMLYDYAKHVRKYGTREEHLTYLKYVFMALFTAEVLNRNGVYHNDLHFNNILIDKRYPGEDKLPVYQVGEFTVYMNTEYTIRVFDFDRATEITAPEYKDQVKLLCEGVRSAPDMLKDTIIQSLHTSSIAQQLIVETFLPTYNCHLTPIQYEIFAKIGRLKEWIYGLAAYLAIHTQHDKPSGVHQLFRID